MRYLIIMYVIMTLGFFWNFQWSLVMFSLTWWACLVFRRHLPQLPYPDIQVEKMYVKTRQNMTIFLCFISPALCVSLVYQMLLTFGSDDFARDWPPSRITGLLVSQNYPVVLIDEELTPVPEFEVVYIFTDMLRSYFFVFAFFVAHWFWFSVDSIEEKILLERWRSSPKSILNGTPWKLLIAVPVVVLFYWMSSYMYPSVIGSRVEKPGIASLVILLASHVFLLMPFLTLLWWMAFSTMQSTINIILVKFFMMFGGGFLK
ncbi:hypothetical protein C8E00_11310 [Chromohalobacter marismortui]|uniref:Uncharacterized protein n=1 Tax=Chromohalobacter marismortui TaxID=42055 RepID=A0A4R7ND25_9GAMM|nr:hypothetical protein [Chromohalobacter marismortui]TDU18109.1 hypothetical protein C8E00_11310 [Chromohalobacter marismortui]